MGAGRGGGGGSTPLKNLAQRPLRFFTLGSAVVSLVTMNRPLTLLRNTTLPDWIRLLANSRSDFRSDALSIRARDEVSGF